MLQLIKSWFTPLRLTPEQAIQILEQQKNEQEEKKKEIMAKYLITLKELFSLLNKEADELGQAPMPDEEHIDNSIKIRVISQRTFFIQQIKLFLEKMKKTPDNEFWQCFQQEWVILTQKTAKSAVFVNHLFYQELASVKDAVQQINKIEENYAAHFSVDELQNVLTEISHYKEIKKKKEERMNELYTQAEEVQKRIRRIREQASSLDNPLEREWEFYQKQEQEFLEEGKTFIARTRRVWEKLAKKIPEEEKTIKYFLAEPWNEKNYQHLHRVLSSALEKKQLGNEEYHKIQKVIEEWNPDRFTTFCHELHEIMIRKESHTALLSPYWERKEKYLQEIATLEKEGKQLEKEKEKLENELQNIPMIETEKLSMIASTLLKKKVIVDA